MGTRPGLGRGHLESLAAFRTVVGRKWSSQFPGEGHRELPWRIDVLFGPQAGSDFL